MSDDRTEEQKQLDKFEKLCKSVKDNIGLSDLEHKIDTLGELCSKMITQVGDTSQKVEQIIPHINRWIQMENGQSTASQGTATQQTQNVSTQTALSQMPNELKAQMLKETISGLGDALKGIAEAYRMFKGGGDAQPNNFLGISEDIIRQNIQESVMGDFETGKAMREMLTGGMKRKVVSKIVNQIVDEGPVHTL